MFGGVTLNIILPTPIENMATFSILDTSTNPISGVSISINSETITTDGNGTAEIELDNGTYSFSVYKIGYIPANGSVVINDVSSNVQLDIPVDYVTGDVGPTSGNIFYVNPDSETDGWKFMEAAPVPVAGDTQSSWIQSALNSTEIGAAAQGVEIGDGLSNTIAIIAGGATSGPAVGTNNYETHGYDDWFCPSPGELTKMYTELYENGLGNFSAASYWSSAENNSTEAWRRSFSGGYETSRTKSTGYLYRAVRRFSELDYYKVSLDGNGFTVGTLPTCHKYFVKGSSVTLPDAPGLSKNGDAFVCWNTNANGFGADYPANSNFVVTGDFQLYAKFESNVLAFLPDTQSYTRYKNQVYEAQVDYLVEQEASLGLVWVGHVGDLVQNWEDPTYASEWTFVKSQMDKLTDASINWALVPGNHDYAKDSRVSTVLNSTFPLSGFQAMSTFEGSYDTKSDNTYHIVPIRGTDWLIMNLEYGPREDVVNWANTIIQNNSNKPCIVMTHALLVCQDVPRLNEFLISSDNHAPSNGYGLGSVPEGCSNGIDMWDDLIYPNNNVKLVICGHDGDSTTGSALNIESHADGSPVYNVLSNFQYWSNYPGYMLLFRIDSSTISFTTYSPYLDEFSDDDLSKGSFNF